MSWLEETSIVCGWKRTAVSRIKAMWQHYGHGLVRFRHTCRFSLEDSILLSCLFFFFFSFWCISMVLPPYSPPLIAAASLIYAPLFASFHTHVSFSPLSLSLLPPVPWSTGWLLTVRGYPSVPPPLPQPRYLALIHQRGSEAVHHSSTTQSLIPASAQCCSRGPSWGTAKAWSLSDDG